MKSFASILESEVHIEDAHHNQVPFCFCGDSMQELFKNAVVPSRLEKLHKGKWVTMSTLEHIGKDPDAVYRVAHNVCAPSGSTWMLFSAEHHTNWNLTEHTKHDINGVVADAFGIHDIHNTQNTISVEGRSRAGCVEVCELERNYLLRHAAEAARDGFQLRKRTDGDLVIVQSGRQEYRKDDRCIDQDFLGGKRFCKQKVEFNDELRELENKLGTLTTLHEDMGGQLANVEEAVDQLRTAMETTK